MHTTKQQQKNVWYSISRDGENRSIYLKGNNLFKQLPVSILFKQYLKMV